MTLAKTTSSRLTNRFALLLLLAAASFASGCRTLPSVSADGAPVAGAAASTDEWIAAKSVPLEKFLDAAPADDSDQTRADLAAMLQIQAQRTPEQCAAAAVDAEKSALRFATALGAPADLRAAQIPRLIALAHRLRETQEAISGLAKSHYDRKRPYVFDARIQPCLTKPSNASYPSGHATWGWLAAYVFADMVPERRDALLERAQSYAQSRVIGGVHYPSDVAAGRIGGVAIASVLFTTPTFRRDEEQARAEIRKLLGLEP